MSACERCGRDGRAVYRVFAGRVSGESIALYPSPLYEGTCWPCIGGAMANDQRWPAPPNGYYVEPIGDAPR